MCSALRCWIDTSICHLPYNNLDQLNKRSLWCALQQCANRKSEYKSIRMCKDCHVYLYLWCYRAFHEVKHFEKLKAYMGITG